MRVGEGGKSSNTRLLSHFETERGASGPFPCPVCGGSDIDSDGFCWDCEQAVIDQVLADITDLLGESDA